VSKTDAQQVVPELVAEAQMVLGDGTAGENDGQLNNPYAVAFVLGHPEWIVTTEFTGHRVKISNILTGALVCKLGELGNGQGQFNQPLGVAVTADSSLVLVVDSENHRVQVLRLVVSADGSSAELEFDRFIGHGYGGHNSIEDCDVPGAEGQLSDPNGIALLPGNGSQEMVLVVEEGSHRVSQFSLEGTFIRIFAGTGNGGSANGELDSPVAIAVLGSSGEVAIADASDDRSVQIFDSAGNFKRQFGSFGVETDGQFQCVTAVVSDDHGNLLILDYTNRLQVFIQPQGQVPSTSAPAMTSDSAMAALRASPGATTLERSRWPSCGKREQPPVPLLGFGDIFNKRRPAANGVVGPRPPSFCAPREQRATVGGRRRASAPTAHGAYQPPPQEGLAVAPRRR
jgi:DNA-binding beta-propeller fold protein YncE